MDTPSPPIAIDPALYWRFRAAAHLIARLEADAALAQLRAEQKLEAAHAQRHALMVEIAARYPALSADAPGWTFNDHGCTLNAIAAPQGASPHASL